jgi:hypothetical protein
MDKQIPERPKPQGGDYRPHYARRSADAYMNHLEAKVAEQAATIEQLERKLVAATEPDMFWDADDGEACEDSIREIVYDRGLEITEISTATRGPGFFAFITGDDEEEPEVVHVFGTKKEAELAIAAIINPQKATR